MFPARCFAPRYFAPRYFPKAGAVATHSPRRAPTLQGALTVRAALQGALAVRAALQGDPDMAIVGVIECFPGEDFTQPFEVEDGGLTGRTLALRVFDRDGTELFEYTTADNITITSDTEYEVDFDSADTNLAPGRYQFSSGFDESGSKNPLSYGRFEVMAPPAI